MRRSLLLVTCIVLAVVGVVAIGLVIAPRPGEPDVPALTGLIAFTDVTHPEDAELSTGVYTVAADGSGRTMVIDYASSPAWSPDGRKIAVGGQDMINAYSASGTDPVERTYGLCDEPSWSPDGRMLACIGPTDEGGMSLVYDDPSSLFLNEKPVTQSIALGEWASYTDAPSWSPDGTRLVLEGEGGEISIIDVRTGRSRMLAATGTAPDWSPTGDLIAYGNGNAIIVSAPDGTTRHTIITSEESVDQPSWSPDAKHIVYAPFKEVYRADEGFTQRVGLGLRIVDADGANDRAITTSGLDPDWQPR